MADEFETEQCCECGLRFGVPVGYPSICRRKGKTFYCPNGHSLWYGEGEADKLRRERDSLKQNAAYLENCIKRAKDEAEHERGRRIALSGQVTKLKNRASAGTCPCCHRTFKQLAAHMANKHPAFKAEPMDDSKVVPLRAS